MGTKDNGEVFCDDCLVAEDAITHIHQNFRGSGVEICQPCLRAALEHLLVTGSDRTFFRRLDAWLGKVATVNRTPA